MDNRFYNEVIAEMKPFFEEHSFVESGDCFKNDKKAVKVSYDEGRQMYLMHLADVDNGVIGEYAEANAWLFDDSQTAKDAASVGMDFTATLRKKMGIKVKHNAVNSQVDLPTNSKGNASNITGFTKKILDFFPVLKEPYKAHIAENGNFLYLNFFGEHLVPQIKSILRADNKKQLKKFYIILEDFYIKGDKETVNAIVAVLSAVAYKDDELKSAVAEMINEDKHMLSSFENFLPVFSKSKKLLSALIK